MKDEIYLDTYVLQQDMRVRMPKSIIANLGVKKGISKFDIFYCATTKSIILKVHEENKEDKRNNINDNE